MEEKKIFIASVRAVVLDPRLTADVIEDTGSLILRATNAAEHDGYLVHSESMPVLLFWMTEAEARAAALQKAEDLLPSESGFSHHSVRLKEIPLRMFVEAQVFATPRRIWQHFLRLTGFTK